MSCRMRIVVARRTSRGDGAPRLGFTLVEMLLVLALMVAIGAIVWPALDKPFAAERLRSSADEFRAELARGRVAAMQSGRLHMLTVDPTTGRLLVHPADESAAPVAMPTELTSSLTAPVVLQGKALPDGIRLQELVAFDDVTPIPATTQAPAAAPLTSTPVASGPGGTSNNSGPITAAQPIYFHPDGTTSSARVTLVNEHGATVVLELRGLTGTARVGETLAAGAIR